LGKNLKTLKKEYRMKDQKENRRLALIYSLGLFIWTELFEVNRYWLHGKVGFISSLKITESWIWELPLRIPSFLDGIIAGIFMGVTVFYINNEKNGGDKYLKEIVDKRMPFFTGLLISLLLSFSNVGLIFFLFVSLLFVIFFFLAFRLESSLTFASGFILTSVALKNSVFGLFLLAIIGLLALIGFVSNFYLYEGVWAEKFKLRTEN